MGDQVVRSRFLFGMLLVTLGCSKTENDDAGPPVLDAGVERAGQQGDSPSGDVAAPAADVAAPAVDVAAPAVDVAAPAVDVAAPAVDVAIPVSIDGPADGAATVYWRLTLRPSLPMRGGTATGITTPGRSTKLQWLRPLTRVATVAHLISARRFRGRHSPTGPRLPSNDPTVGC